MTPTCPKRKRDSTAPTDSKRPRLTADPSSSPPASTPLPTSAHEPLLSALSAKYSVLVLSFISSTQLRTRISRIVEHMAAAHDKPAVVMLHARPADVGKMISAAEKAKALVAATNKKTKTKAPAWVQYNRLFASAATKTPAKKTAHKNRKPAVEENDKDKTPNSADKVSAAPAENEQDEQKSSTSGGKEENTQEQEDDYFESTAQRFADAANPPKPTRPTMSLSIFLSTESIPELRNNPDTTTQTSDALAA